MKKQKRRLRMLWSILQRTKADKIIMGYVFTILCASGLLYFIEPGFERFGDAVWYCYTMGVTIGFGDFVAITAIGRIISIFISLYTLLLVGMIPAIVVSYYMEIIKVAENETVTEFFDQLEHLPELSKSELQALSDKIKKMDKRCMK
ncbi:MAG: potassium channel family protein [Anaerovoracaceae bacterium]